MIKFLKEILTAPSPIRENLEKPKDDKLKLQVATCALFLELAYSDDDFAESEKEHIVKVMKEIFGLGEEYINGLIELAEERRSRSVSLYEYTDIINAHFTNDEKYEVLKNLWQLVFVDNKLDAYEQHFMRKITGNLKMAHSDMIAAKMEVKKELDNKN